MENEKRCIGCGAVIQSADPQKPGYLPENARLREDAICQRCFRIKHYGDVQAVPLQDEDYLRILHEIGDRKGLVVKVVDIFDFEGSWLPGLTRFVGNRVLVVANKSDLLPKSVNRDRLIRWLKKKATENGLDPLDCVLVSSERGWNMDEAIRLMEKHRKGGDIFVVGCTNVGKSTFINRILHELKGSGREITTSFVPGTTLDLIEIPFGDGGSIFDTPGIINHHQMAHFVSKKDLKKLMPKKEIRPRIYQVNERQTLFFGGLARLDYLRGGRRSLVCYLSNDIPVHRTKLENADHLYRRHLGRLLSPPDEESAKSFPPFVCHEFSVRGPKTDVVFSGLGWVTVVGEKGAIRAYAPEGVGVSIREPLI